MTLLEPPSKTKPAPSWAAWPVASYTASIPCSRLRRSLATLAAKIPISLKKLEQDYGQWHHKKDILGFELDGDAKTVRI
jgi:hypothetical protein